MRKSDIDWRSGHVVFWDIESVDSGHPLSDQLSELKEDLVQVIYADDIVLDVGWYPEFSANGEFLIVVSQNERWDKPIFEERCSSVQDLIRALERAIDVAEPQGS